MIKYIGIGIAGLALVGCTQAAPTPAPTVTVTAAPTVAPPAPVQTMSIYQDMLDAAWDGMTNAEQENTCFAWTITPDEAWQAFNEGAEGAIPRSEFEQFLSRQCGY